MVTRFLRRTGKRLSKAGLKGLPTMHNIPIAEHTSILGQGSVQRVVDIVGLDYYYLASPGTRRTIARRTTELALRGDAHDRPSFACELAAGFPPFMAPMLLRDNAFTVMTALAYGLGGYNAYMAVERDRWIGAPIDPRGQPRPSSAFWKTLNEAMERTGFASLRRRVPVRIVTPRAAIRLRRVLNAFGPASGAAFAVMGVPASAHCRDDDFGTGQPIASSAETFVDTVEAALEAEGIVFGHVGDDDPAACVHDAAWVIVAAPAGAVEPDLLAALEEFVWRGGRVTFGPTAPSRGPTLRELEVAPSFTFAVVSSDVSEHVAQMRGELSLSRVHVEPVGSYASLFEDEQGVPRMLFAIQPSEADIQIRISLPGEGEAVDVLTGERVAWRDGTLELSVSGRTVRMVELRGP